MDRGLLSEGLEAMGIESSTEAERRFDEYMNLLLEWNGKMNLTAITDKREIVVKHFIDSASCLKIEALAKAERMIDVGTGAGFPGIPLRILSGKGHWVLADSLGKRVKFLNKVIEDLELEEIEAVHARAEELGRDPKLRESFDVAVSRAVANLAVLSEYCLPLVRVGGVFIAMKGPKAAQEIAEAGKAIEILGGKIWKKIAIQNPFAEMRHEIIVIKKERPTPSKYPRRPGLPSRNPIMQGEKK